MADFATAPDPQSPQVLPTAQGPGPPRPKSVVIAVRLMYAGAAGLPLWALGNSLCPTPSGSGGAPGVGTDILAYALLVLPVTALWLWMALLNKRGRSWARILSTAFYALLGIAAPALLGWAIGLATIVLLWQRKSSAYFDGGTAAPRCRGFRPDTDGDPLRNLVLFQPVPLAMITHVLTPA